MKADLEKALLLAIQAHHGQKDKAGKPYILHPLRVMLQLTTLEEQQTAILHDVIEDSSITITKLEQSGFSIKVISAVNFLTRKKNQSYEKYIDLLKKNPLARKVKLGDLQDNMDLSRIKKLTIKDKMRLIKYQKAYNNLK